MSPDIRGLAHLAGKSVVVVLTPLHLDPFFSPSALPLVQIRKRFKNDVDHNNRQCQFTAFLLSPSISNLLFIAADSIQLEKMEKYRW